MTSAQLARCRLLAGAFASAVVLCTACSSSPTAPSPQDPSAPVRLLMLTATAGFRHDSIATARQVLANLAGQTGAFTVTATEDLSAVSAANLANYDVLFFALTSGDLASPPIRKPRSWRSSRAAVDFSAHIALPTRSTTGPSPGISSVPTSGNIPGRSRHPSSSRTPRTRRRQDLAIASRSKRSSTRFVTTLGPGSRSSCGWIRLRLAAQATTRWRGRSRTGAAVSTTTRSGTFRRPGTTRGSSNN